MPISFALDQSDSPNDIGGVDATFYQRQVPASGPFGDNGFAMATARAKDKARVKLIHAIQAEQERHAADEFIPTEVYDVASGKEAGKVETIKGALEEFFSAVVFL